MATKDDLDRISNTQADVIARMERLERGLTTVLTVVSDGNQLLKELSDLPGRVSRLERSVFRRDT